MLLILPGVLSDVLGVLLLLLPINQRGGFGPQPATVGRALSAQRDARRRVPARLAASSPTLALRRSCPGAAGRALRRPMVAETWGRLRTDGALAAGHTRPAVDAPRADLRHGSNIGRLQRPARSARSASRNRCGYCATEASRNGVRTTERKALRRAMRASAFAQRQTGGHDRDAVPRCTALNARRTRACASRNARVRGRSARPATRSATARNASVGFDEPATRSPERLNPAPCATASKRAAGRALQASDVGAFRSSARGGWTTGRVCPVALPAVGAQPTHCSGDHRTPQRPARSAQAGAAQCERGSRAGQLDGPRYFIRSISVGCGLARARVGPQHHRGAGEDHRQRQPLAHRQADREQARGSCPARA